ncbi:MAG: Phosphate-specific transport system accessory protein PhoU-like protein 1 [Thermotoga petrophila]|jgi:phosphate transport system protein|nr:Phosphate transport system regulatory protein PhoU [Thermotoga maritima MSB8]KUK23073.1 MAG: Phosphate-specific transport system accessory protein PhoU-like protein 1 [Thermotoga petrophila]MBZ4661458.1 Phosphate transport system regulatory protein PhoU [Thermotoga sp.]
MMEAESMVDHVHFERELTLLKSDVSKMLFLVSESLNDAIESLETMNETLARKVLESDDMIDELNREIEEKAYQIIARYNPILKQLRYIITILKFSNDLERIGDLSCNIAEKCLFLSEEKIKFEMLKELKDMFGSTLKVVQDAFKAFVEEDVDLAFRLWKFDDVIDEMEKKIRRIVVERIREGNISAELALVYILIARDLERVGDHANNLCEEVIYIETGKNMKEFLRGVESGSEGADS